MNIKAKQINGMDITRMDITTVLGFFMQIKGIILPNDALVTVLATVWTAYVSAITAFDDAYAQVKKWMQTDELKDLDKVRDGAQSAFLNMLKAALASPNGSKREAAKRVKFVRDKYSLDAGDEYMKQTYAVKQMCEEMQASDSLMQDLALIGLDDFLLDLVEKNDAFLAKMNERTDAQTGLQKGIVREKRLAAEAAYRDLMKLINALAIVEYPAGMDYNPAIDRLNAEIEHYRQILARKGGSSSSSSSQQGGTSSQQGGTNSGTEEGGEQGGSSSEGGGQQGGSELPPSGGGEVGDDNGGSSENGGGDNGGGLPPSGGGEVGDNSGGGGAVLPGSGGEG